MGRTVLTIADYTDGVPTDNSNQTTGYTYDGDGHTLTMTAVMPEGQISQTTKCVYGVNTAQGSTINSNDLLAMVEYPDPTTGLASSNASAQTCYTYNAQGQVLRKTDQNGSTHTYSYDVLGRRTSDAVQVAEGNPQNVDTSVLRIETNYNSQGQVYQVTNYDAASGGNVVNQVQREYNGLGQLVREYQSQNGPVDTDTTPKVQYAHGDLSNGSRMTSMTYPNGYSVCQKFSLLCGGVSPGIAIPGLGGRVAYFWQLLYTVNYNYEGAVSKHFGRLGPEGSSGLFCFYAAPV